MHGPKEKYLRRNYAACLVNEVENTVYQDVWGITKSMLREFLMHILARKSET